MEVPGLPRFWGGAVGYISYDYVRFIEGIGEKAKDDLAHPDCVFMITDTLIIFDHVTQKMKAVALAHIDGSDPEAAYRNATGRVDALIGRLEKGAVPPPGVPDFPASSAFAGELVADNPGLHSTFSRERFNKAVAEVVELIHAGEAIQVVLAQRLEGPMDVHPFAVYRALRTVNPSPYMFYLTLGDTTLVGASPEVLVRREGNVVEVRPIAGTRRRGMSGEEDRALAKELLSDEKERAEHIMLVDLHRNDIGRVCKPGTVKVDELMVVERYSHVMHICSNVTGELMEGADQFDLLRATFPAGTLSGAAKIRAMEIIEEFEPVRRGPYGGAVGYFGFSGSMDTCITLRTIVMKGNTCYFQAGGGIVADSEPDAEHQETVNKAAA
ncbi:MAG: chorismate-binding protein, partial [Nitrospinota bacterium]|nr:chorismate-binding protein [Nitrospinota bacterium]